jgi:hypothetical protein
VLDQVIAAAGLPVARGRGARARTAAGASPSRLVIGIYRENAEALGRLFGQNAIVFIEKGAAPELLVLA